jgi:uncharacterized damage-inducible protein DinB
MNMHDVRDIFAYNRWANGLILNAASRVTPEQFFAPSTHSFGSLHGTLVHILDTDCGWRILLLGQGFAPEITPADLPDLDSVRSRWQEEQNAWNAYLESLRDEDLSSTIRYEVEGGSMRERVVWHCLYHVVNHGMQHRSEAAHLLTSYGQSPGDLDFTRFLNERTAASLP